VRHRYFDFADIENACGGSGCYNVLARLKSSHNPPIMLSKDGTLCDDGSNLNLLRMEVVEAIS
jgi:hypothetical protein